MRKIKYYILFMIIVCYSCDLRKPEHYYDLAYEAEERGEYKKAIELLDIAINKKPNFRPALLNRGADKSMLGDYNGAIEDYIKIIEFDSDNTMALVNIGNNYKKLDLYDKAIEYYNKALNTKGALRTDIIQLEFVNSYSFDADMNYYLKDYEIRYERGIAYALNKEYQLAIKDLDKAIINNYEIAYALAWLGESYLAINDTVNACLNLKKSSDLGIIDAEELYEEYCKE